MAIKIQNLKPGFSICENSVGDAYAYEHERFHLLDPNADPEELITLYWMNDQGLIDYEFEAKLPRKDLKPKFVKLE